MLCKPFPSTRRPPKVHLCNHQITDDTNFRKNLRENQTTLSNIATSKGTPRKVESIHDDIRCCACFVCRREAQRLLTMMNDASEQGIA
eukprot:3164439-Amphidinium_carterae.2